VRFASTLGGAKALAGRFDARRSTKSAKTACRAARRCGVRLRSARGCREEALSPEHALGYVEVHIEQGPVLEKEGLPVGIVTAIDGVTRGTVEVEGVAGHAGTVPMPMRKDALAAAAEMLLAVEERARARSNLVATVGKMEVPASAANTIPGRRAFTLDIRSPSDQERLSAVGDIKERSPPSRNAAASPPSFPSATKCRRHFAIKSFPTRWRKRSKPSGSRRGGCRAAPATTPWRSTGSFRSPCCSCAAAAE
jgi:allantoate deiminase